ncbi:MAG TPA: chemotaxis protein CheB [Variovorax sp.]|nr:chemotaxis protein CheB [Variovorax sp.]
MLSEASPTADPEEAGLAVSDLDFPVVGIGASAGGLAALQTFFAQLPPDSGMAFVVILHLSPKHESNAAEILQRSTAMPVVQVQGRAGIEADHVYIIPPTSDLEMDDGCLRLQALQRTRGGVHAAIDLFFRTLAQVHGERGICVVLSGTGSDGAVGLTRVKEAGGVTLAQSPADAEYDGMPRAAIATGMVDIVLPVGQIPQRLVALWNNMRHIRMPADITAKLDTEAEQAHTPAQRAETALADIMTLMRLHTRHDFKHYKRATVLRRIERRLQVNGLPDLPAYRDHIRHNPGEAPHLLQDLLISVTNFFRDREAFEALEREVIPTLFEGQRAVDEPIRVWVAGCATGEEAYSIAILLREQIERAHAMADFQIFATDIDDRAVAVARAGLYPGAISTDVSPQRLARFFVKEGESYRVIKPIREKVLFAAHNVLRDPPFSRLDLVCCRNLLIYLERRAQASILDMFRFALKPNATLFLGVSESPDAAGESFVAVDKKHRIYRSAPGAGPVRNLPTLVAEPPDGRARSVVGLRSERRQASNAEIHRRSLEQLLPPSVLVDAQFNILHLSEGAGLYMEHGSGLPSHNLLSNVSPELRLELRSALRAASQSRQNVEVRNVRLDRGGQPRSLHLSVRPFKSEEDAELALVVFDEADAQAPAEDLSQLDEATRKLVTHLEQENRQLKEHLQETIEHSETSTEELKASNEELQAINEELRSATEELETSKEELQATNEELTTVNYELKLKVEETGLINDDLQNFIASADIATVFVDRGLNIKRFTPQAATLFNLISSDVGRSLLDITHRLEYPALGDDAQQVFVSLRVIERSMKSNDGKQFLARFLPYRTAEDKIVGAVLTFIDITALHAARQEVHAGEERLRVAAEMTRDFAIITTDDEGVVTGWNAGAARMFQWREDEIIGQSADLVFTDEDRAKGVPQAEMAKALSTGRADDERWHKRKDGSTFYCSGVMTPMAAADVRGFSKIARDMTEHRQLSETKELLLAQEQALRRQALFASTLKDEFLAVMSHELKHPLNLIHVNAQLLTRMPEARKIPAVARAGEAIRRAANSQAKIIDDLLDLSRARTGKMALRIEELVINETIAAIVRAAEADARAAGVELSFECTSKPVQVACDQVRLEQIAWNLVSNALKFTPPGGRVTVQLEVDAQARRACLTVQDTGKGIDAHFLPHVFEMFSQEGFARRPGERGLGIGLALVRELAQALGGSVSAASEGVGSGSTFRVLLPLAEAAVERSAAPGPKDENPLAELRILLVDDSKETLSLFKELLELEEAIVDTAPGGKDALEKLGANEYDLLISDLGMPEMTGYELIAEVRKMPGNSASVPAIALSGYGREADAERAVGVGFDGHLSKPASIDDVKAQYLALRRRAQA